MENALIRILPACLTDSLPEGWNAESPGTVIEVADPVQEPDAIVPALATVEPDVLLIDADYLDLDVFALTQQAIAARADLAVVIISRDAAPDKLRRAMLSGAEEYLIKPLDAKDLASAITAVTSHRTLRRVQRTVAPEAEVKTGIVVGVVAGKGGLGKTTLATNLAAIVARTPGRKAALVGLESGDGAVLLNIQPRLGLLDLVGSSEQGDQDTFSEEWVKQFATSHKSGLNYWAWQGSNTQPGAVIPEDFFHRLFDAYRQCFDVTIIDFPQLSQEEAAAVMPLLDMVIAVSSSSDLLALRSAKTLIDTMPPEIIDRLHMIINRADPTDMISKEDFERTLGRSVMGVIANEPRLVAEAINMGAPFVLIQKDSEITGDLNELAQLLFKLPQAEDLGRKKRFRLFG
jgi:pilus assembly protein CpaE